MTRKIIPIVILLCLLSGAAGAAERKLFIREIATDRGCIGVSPQALLAQIAQEVPREVLLRRSLRYEDLPAYLDVQRWNPERFDVRESASILRVLRGLDMRFMLWLELSCLPPGSGQGRYVLTGRLTDLDAMDRVLSCPRHKVLIRDGRRMCNVGGDVFDAVSYTHVRMRDFDGFMLAVRRLLARLLHIPEVEFASPNTRYDPGEEINQPFLLRHNDGTEQGYAGPRARVTAYRIAQDVIELPGDLVRATCAAPERHWARLSCGAGFAGPGCDAADRVRFRVRSLIHQEVAARSPGASREGGGERITLRAAPHNTDYLIRAVAIAKEEGGEIRSEPVYRCVQVVTRPYYFGVAARIGYPFDGVRASDPYSSIYPAAGLVHPSVGIDLLMVRYFPRLSTRTRILPAQALGVVLGFTQLSGSYPCPNQAHGGGCAATPPYPPKVSTAYVLEARAQIRTDLFRLWRLSPRLLVDIGLGLEVLGSTPSFSRDGVHGQLLAGLGGGLGFSIGAPGMVGFQGQVAFLWQNRMRLDNAAVQVNGGVPFIDAAGVPNLVQTYTLICELLIAPPRR